MSKLAALAAKRRQKENLKPTESANSDSQQEELAAVSSLKDLRIASGSPPRKKDPALTISSRIVSQAQTQGPKRSASSPDSLQTENFQTLISDEVDWKLLKDPPDIRGPPSAFASSLFESARNTPVPSQILQHILQTEAQAKPFDFTELSPDDVVAKAQNAKGSNDR